MSVQEKPWFIRGVTLPPSGWVLTILLVVYIFVGLIGHDPWKHDDAITIALVHDIVRHGHWFTPQLAGQVYPDAPFYYWVAAVTAHLFSWLIPLHDAARLASGLFTLLALEFILLAARELYGHDQAAAAPLTLAGSIGFLFHAHEAQPMLAALTAHTAAYWALAMMVRRPRMAVPVLGLSVAICFLANGVLPTLALLPAVVVAIGLSSDRLQFGRRVLIGAVLGAAIVALWMIPLGFTRADYLSAFIDNEFAQFSDFPLGPQSVLRYANFLLWYAWPALPLAAWALWAKRRTLRESAQAFPLLTFLLVLLLVSLSVDVRSSTALLLLPPIVLLAVPGVMTLRRGARNAFDWFGMMAFSLFVGVAWLVWSAMALGWPERMARQVVRLEPGFVGRFDGWMFAAALIVTIAWFWLIVTSPRSPMRNIMHWMAGLTTFWVLVATLWMPWIDYGKTYRPVSQALAKALPAKDECVASTGIPKSILGTLDYFNGIRALPQSSDEGGRCRWLLVLGDIHNPQALNAAGWRPVWEGRRPGDRRSSDKFRLFHRRDAGKNASPAVDVTNSPSDLGAN